MGKHRKSFIALAALCLPGCIYYTQPPPQVNTGPAPAPDYTPSQVVNTYAPEPAPAPAPQEVVVYQPPPPEVAPIYQDDLAPYGRWIVYSAYGRCWVPNGVAYGWQPYTVGHWVYADDGNCYWVSEANEVAWGGIVYHYGQWAYTSDFGWIWVPGTTYAPAWVAWRDGGGYCGWAPLPPEACYGGTVTYVVADRYCPRDRYVYVPEGDVNVTRVDERVIRNNTTIINNTTNITNITIVNNHVVNNGVSTDAIERRSGKRVDRVNVADASSADQARALTRTGVPVRYSNPAIEQVHQRTAPKISDAQIQHDQQIAQQRQLQLNNQVQTDKALQQENQAAHQQQLQLDQQLQQQKQIDQSKQRELNTEVQKEKQTDHQAEIDAAKQAEVQKQQQHQQEVEAQKQAHDQQVESDRQAAAQQAAQQASQREAQRQQQIEAQRQAAADQRAEQERQSAAARDHQANPDQQNVHGQGQQNPGAGEKPKPKPKPQPGQNPGGPPQ